MDKKESVTSKEKISTPKKVDKVRKLGHPVNVGGRVRKETQEAQTPKS